MKKERQRTINRRKERDTIKREKQFESFRLKYPGFLEALANLPQEWLRPLLEMCQNTKLSQK